MIVTVCVVTYSVLSSVAKQRRKIYVFIVTTAIAPTLCSDDSMTLVVRTTRCSALGDRAFPVSAARTWIALPSAISQSCIVTRFVSVDA